VLRCITENRDEVSSTGDVGAVISAGMGGRTTIAALVCGGGEGFIVVAFVLGVVGVEDGGVEVQASGMVAMFDVW
jgi:hypothetical protein